MDGGLNPEWNEPLSLDFDPSLNNKVVAEVKEKKGDQTRVIGRKAHLIPLPKELIKGKTFLLSSRIGPLKS